VAGPEVEVRTRSGSSFKETMHMPTRSLIGAVAAAAVMFAATAALAFDDAKYPDWKGLWTRARVPGAVGQPPHDPAKPPGRGQGAPLTPEYQARFEANLADQANGGQGTSSTFTCLPNGMPRMMSAYEPLEFIVTPDITYVLIDHIEHSRHVFTDGRDWPPEIEPTWVGHPTTPAACRCTRTMRASSRSASGSTRPTATSCTTRSPPSTMR
jgi:hypothetical protein